MNLMTSTMANLKRSGGPSLNAVHKPFCFVSFRITFSEDTLIALGALSLDSGLDCVGCIGSSLLPLLVFFSDMICLFDRGECDKSTRCDRVYRESVKASVMANNRQRADNSRYIIILAMVALWLKCSSVRSVHRGLLRHTRREKKE